jgi:hypothetical protein
VLRAAVPGAPLGGGGGGRVGASLLPLVTAISCLASLLSAAPPPAASPLHPPLSPGAEQGDKDLGFLMSPGEGAVTALAFFTPAAAYNPTHLLSGSADGSIRRVCFNAKRACNPLGRGAAGCSTRQRWLCFRLPRRPACLLPRGGSTRMNHPSPFPALQRVAGWRRLGVHEDDAGPPQGGDCHQRAPFRPAGAVG